MTANFSKLLEEQAVDLGGGYTARVFKYEEFFDVRLDYDATNEDGTVYGDSWEKRFPMASYLTRPDRRALHMEWLERTLRQHKEALQEERRDLDRRIVAVALAMERVPK